MEFNKYLEDEAFNLNSTILFDKDIEMCILNKEYKIRHWSYITNCKKGDEQYYIKIPKSDFASSNILDDIAILKNKQMAFEEAISLIELNEIFSFASPNLSVVKYIGYSKKFNALITKKFEGDMLYEKSGISNKELYNKYYSNAGHWLKHFHKHSPKVSVNNSYSMTYEQDKLNNLLNWLNFNHKRTYIDVKNQLSHLLNISESNVNDLICYNLPGYELRNFLFDSHDKLCFLDPGKKQIGTIMDDIARFLISIDMIRWGKLDAYTNQNFYEYKHNFLKSYFGKENMFQSKVLAFYIVKWLLIRWYDSYERLNEGRVQSYLIPFVRKGYIDILFKRWLKTYMEAFNV